MSVDVRKRRGNVRQIREHEDRRERDDDPWPWAQRVVHDVEEERTRQRIALAPGGKHALRDVTAAARLGAGIPNGPPLYGEWNDEERHRQPPIAEVGQESDDVRS